MLMYAQRSFLLILLVALSACAVFGETPEARIQKAYQTHTAATNATANLLQRNRLNVDQAKDAREFLRTARGTLDTADKNLKSCRLKNPPANPDPCATNIQADVNLASQVLLEVESFLKAKE